MNVIIFGETGSGKSSLVNLLLGNEEAEVSDKAKGCTFEFTKYPLDSNYLFDTVGLSEGSRGTVRDTFAIKKLYDLLISLQDGVSLLILVMHKGRITKSLEDNFKVFVNDICMNNVPVVLAVTHCEDYTEPGQWWNENKKTFDSYGWNIKGAVCCCCQNPDKAWPEVRPRIMSMRESTRIELQNVIQKTQLTEGWVYKGGVRAWFEKTVQVVLSTYLGVMLSPARLLSLNILKVDEREAYEKLTKWGVNPKVASVFSSALVSASNYLKNM